MSTLFLASDSTVQTYPKSQYPQTGWGQVLYTFFKDSDKCRIYVRPDAIEPHITTYEMPSFSIENHAFAARSSRSFIEQGRLDNILKVAGSGDYMMIQFAHNDAYEAKAERYVPVDKFGDWLYKYKEACDNAGMTPIFVTPVSMRVFDDNGKCRIAFKEYRDAMLEAADKFNCACIDLSYLSTEMFTKVGPEGCRDIFLWTYPGEYPEGAFKDGSSDNAHFQEYGARLMASIVAGEIKRNLKGPEFDKLRDALADDFHVDKPVRKYPEGFKWEDETDMENAARKEILNRK